MYSIVVAAMLSTGPQTPGFNGFFANMFGGRGCAGCQGQCIGCNGCGGCMGGSGCNGCGGCCGGNSFLGIRAFWHNVFSGGCNGGCGGCSGCNGCSGCCGGCNGCFGGCSGCYGGASYSYGMPMDHSMMSTMPAPMMAAPTMMPAPEAMATAPYQLPQGPAPQPQQAQTPPNQAMIMVTLPADARLFVDGQALTLTGPVRQFRTPDLQPGVAFTYTLRMEVERNGKTVDETKTVDLRAGKVTQVFFAEPGTPGSPAKINVQLPENATLFVENQPWPAGQSVIVTPGLNKGQEYTYTLRIEHERNGRKETRSKEITLKSGAELTVEFESETLMAGR